MRCARDGPVPISTERFGPTSIVYARSSKGTFPRLRQWWTIFTWNFCERWHMMTTDCWEQTIRARCFNIIAAALAFAAPLGAADSLTLLVSAARAPKAPAVAAT